MGKLNLPVGKKIAVNHGVDVDAQPLWLGGFNRPSPSFMSRGEFGAVAGIPRLIKLFKKYGVRSTFFTPGHAVHTFPKECRMPWKQGMKSRITAIITKIPDSWSATRRRD